jgi:hypothetical protein
MAVYVLTHVCHYQRLSYTDFHYLERRDTVIETRNRLRGLPGHYMGFSDSSVHCCSHVTMISPCSGDVTARFVDEVDDIAEFAEMAACDDRRNAPSIVSFRTSPKWL